MSPRPSVATTMTVPGPRVAALHGHSAVAGRAPVTVVVPNFNGARHLTATLQSLMAQTVEPAVLLLLDNRSTDDSVAVAETLRHPRLRVVRAETHVSMAENWTRALGLADTPYVLLAHADDLYAPRYLEATLTLLEQHPRAFMAHCRVASIDEDGRPYEAPQELLKERAWPRTHTYERSVVEEFRVLRRGNYILAPAALLRTGVARRIGPFNTAYQFVTDWEYWLRGLLDGGSIVGTRERLVRYRRHRTMGTRRHETSLARYREELALSVWAASAGHAAGLLPDPTPELALVRNTLLADFAGRLRRGEWGAARELLDFARHTIPGFRRSLRDRLMAAALHTRGAGALALAAAESAYVAYVRLSVRRGGKPGA